MKELPFAQESQSNRIKRTKKSENRKEISVIFQTTLNKTEKAEKPHLRSFDGDKGAIWKAERPKTASSPGDVFSESCPKNRPKRSGFPHRPGFPENVRPDSAERKKQKKQFEDKDSRCCCCCGCCWRVPRPECSEWLDLGSRSWSGCGSDAPEEGRNEPWTRFNRSSRPPRKCRSNPNFSKMDSKKVFDGERELHKIKRSLRLLGFELSDFGIPSEWEEKLPKKKPGEKSASFSTKITNRSVSLDSLRAAVKRAWMDDRLDESHRRLLAQAAYEEWYFKKERELWMKRNEERLSRLEVKESLRDHFERKKEQSEKEFRKWLNKKRTKRKGNEKDPIQNQESPLDKLTKTKEESEKAFVKWIKTKEEELEKKKREKKKEEEKRLQSEKEKNKKKITAEKAFQQWKTKLKEAKMLKEATRERQKKRQKMQERRKREEGHQISFEMWKSVKDEQIKEKAKQIRQARRIAREERLALTEERMYEAEQAFEDWLEKVESRKQKQFSGMNSCKTIPWIPA